MKQVLFDRVVDNADQWRSNTGNECNRDRKAGGVVDECKCAVHRVDGPEGDLLMALIVIRRLFGEQGKIIV